MPWDRSAPTNPKYRSKAHRDERAKYERQMQRDGYVVCTADVCLFHTRAITNPDGMASDGLNAGHEADGVNYRGPQHRACNLQDGAVRGRAKQGETQRWRL